MLKAGNTADPAPFAAALGQMQWSIPQVLTRHPAAAADRLHARSVFVNPLLRGSLAALWIATGLLSFGIYPLEDALRLLGQVGLASPLADIALFGGAMLDLGLGLLLLAARRPR